MDTSQGLLTAGQYYLHQLTVLAAAIDIAMHNLEVGLGPEPIPHALIHHPRNFGVTLLQDTLNRKQFRVLDNIRWHAHAVPGMKPPTIRPFGSLLSF